jgi:beta-lactamase regulating signal transducer with metallopeptidase domain
MRADVPVRASSSVAEPMAFRLIRPMVLVPVSLLTQCPVEMWRP